MRRAPLLVALVAGCATAPPRKAHVDPPRRAEPATTFVSPARWAYHPPPPSAALAAVAHEGGCVFTAEGGQRWTAAATKQGNGRLTCAGKVEASAAVAGEDLSSLLRRADGTWIFVGASGALYEAPDPLAPFTRALSAPEPLARVTSTGSSLLATTVEGRLLRWEEASGWKPAVTAGPLLGARVFDVALGEGGRALALAFPEALYASTDGGASFTRAGAPAIGARALGRTAGGELGAVGLYESVVWRGDAFTRGTESVTTQQAKLDLDAGRVPSAGAVQSSRAVLDGDRYYEVVRPDNDGDPWLLARGRIDGRLSTSPLPKSEKCGNVRLGARDRVLYAVCVTADGGDITADVRRSLDQGATWADDLRLSAPEVDPINVAVAPDGSALVSGVCRPEAGACKPGPPVRLRFTREADRADAGADAGAPKEEALRAFAVSAPQLQGAALVPAFSHDGRSAYFLGRRGKDDRIHLFVSHDAGETFTPRTLEGTSPPRSARRPQADDEEPDAPPEGPDVFEVDDQSSIRPGEDGAVGMLLLRSSRGDTAYVLADDDGRVLQVSGTPAEAVEEEGRGMLPIVMSGHGRRVIALGLAPVEAGSLFWESLDGGASWDRHVGPPLLAREHERGQPGLACGLAGCLMGEAVTRLGWGAADPGAPLAPALEPPTPALHLRTPITCELSKAPWVRVEHAIGGFSYALSMPSANESMRGRSVWAVATWNPATGALGSVSAELPEAGEGEARVVTRSLLPALPRGRRFAVSLSPTQHEGIAAVRWSMPPGAAAAEQGAPLRDLDVVWENFFEGAVTKSRIADAGKLEAGDITPSGTASDGEHTSPVAAQLHASLISITSRGLFLHPHEHAPPAFFIDATGRAQRYTPHTWPPLSPVGGAVDLRAEGAALGGSLFDVALSRDADGEWGAIAVAQRVGSGASATVKQDVLALLPAQPGTASLNGYTTWAWSAASPIAMITLASSRSFGRAWAHFVALRPDGSLAPPEPVPTLLDLGDRPRPCSAAERASTPRHVQPSVWRQQALLPGTRHPVIVREPKSKGAAPVDEAFVLLTSGAVVQGTLASPCVAAWEAPTPGETPAMAAVLPGDLAHAWLFRHVVDVPRGARRAEGVETVPSLEYRPMSCRYDPSARTPETLLSEPGTTRP